MQARRATSAADHAAPTSPTEVIAHPSFRQVPASLFALVTPGAQTEYDTIARTLFERGLLTLGMHRGLSSYAMQFDAIARASAEGRPVRASWFAQLDKARKELRLDAIDKPIAAPSGTPTNKFARTGFASRRG